MGGRVGDAGNGEAPPGYRLPAGARPGAVRLQVSELDRSVDYYTTVLGLPIRERGKGVAELGPDTTLVELRERPGAAPVPRRGRLGLFHFAILLPERAELGRFAGHLASLGVPAGASDHFVSEALYLQDPDGLGIEVYADRPRSEWRYRAGELVMATEPLDVRGLVAAGGDAPWSGTPEGTVMGHVHLHVGDLDRASAFYHDALGLDRVVWSYPGALFLSAGGYHHHLGLNTWARGAPPAGPDDARLLEWELVLPSEEAVEAAAVSLEAGDHDLERSGPGNVVARDPWGTAVRLRAGRPQAG
jgi:catechol 2,3-dioxygenase